MDYEVYLENDVAGKVQITRQGLYCRLLCRCMLPQDSVFRLYGVMGGKCENLGVLIPDGDGFLLDRRMPAKRLEGCTQFLLSDGRDPKPEAEPEQEAKLQQEAEPESGTEIFVPIRPEEPFDYLRRLESSVLEVQNGQPGILIQKDSGAV